MGKGFCRWRQRLCIYRLCHIIYRIHICRVCCRRKGKITEGKRGAWGCGQSGTESRECISDNLFRFFTVTKLRFFRTGFIKRIFNRISGCKLCRTVCRKSICIWWDKPYKRNGLFRICNVCIRTFRCQPSTQLKCFKKCRIWRQHIKHAAGWYRMLQRTCCNLCWKQYDCTCKQCKRRY